MVFQLDRRSEVERFGFWHWGEKPGGSREPADIGSGKMQKTGGKDPGRIFLKPKFRMLEQAGEKDKALLPPILHTIHWRFMSEGQLGTAC